MRMACFEIVLFKELGIILIPGCAVTRTESKALKLIKTNFN